MAQTPECDNPHYQAEKFEILLKNIDNYFPDSTNISKAADIGLFQLIRSIDPHSEYFPPGTFNKVKEDISSREFGPGFRISFIEGRALVSRVFRGSGAHRAGLSPCDEIISINGWRVKPDEDRINDLLIGAKDSVINLECKCAADGNKKRIEFDRTGYYRPTVSAACMIDDSVGYIKCDKFSKTTSSEFLRSADELIDRGMEYLIFDLRGNRGGIMEQAAAIADEFLPSGRRIVYTKSKTEKFRLDYRSGEDGRYLETPLVLLIDEETISAAEIFAGAMQDNDRAYIIGLTSAGKAKMQKIWEFTDGSGFKLTVARFYTPLGRLIEKMPKDRIEICDNRKYGDDRLVKIPDKNQSGKMIMDIFTTPAGRTIIGGGGIVPDLTVFSDTIPKCMKKYAEYDMFFGAACHSCSGKGEDIKKYKNDLKLFIEDFYIGDDDLEYFFGLLRQYGLMRRDRLPDSRIIAHRIKAEAAGIIAGDGYENCVYCAEDKMVRAALENIHEAVKLLKFINEE